MDNLEIHVFWIFFFLNFTAWNWLSITLCKIQSKNKYFNAVNSVVFKFSKLRIQQRFNFELSSSDPDIIWLFMPRICFDRKSLSRDTKQLQKTQKKYKWLQRYTTPLPLCNQALGLSSPSVSRTLLSLNPHMAAYLDSIPGQVLRDCAEQLKDDSYRYL